VRVFVAGASGAIGRPLVRQLIAAGHEVTGMTRREEKAAELRGDGAEAVVCDVFDPEALREAVVAARPERVVHMLTALPPRFTARTDLEPTNRVRTEGTRNLITAAQVAGAKRMVAESVSFFYAPEGGWVKDEEAPLDLDAPGKVGPAVAAVADLERQVLSAEGLEGVVLRFGWFYGPGTYITPGGSQAEEVRKRRYPVVGEGDATFSFIHIDDAAAAVVAALDHGEPGVYNVTDDEPSPMREWLPALAELLGARPPRRLPPWLVRLAVGKAVARSAVGTRGASNEKAKRELDWQPAHPSWCQGFPELFAA
jgi:nucleoside-diphosphate-sugar epimerase